MSGSVNDSRDKSSIMDGEEKEERIVDIYITAEAVRDIKHKKQTEESETTTKTTTQQPEHKDGWIEQEVRLYLISSELKNWTESRSYCRDRGADLIIINNKEEQDFVNNITSGAQHWIGLSDSDVEGTWKWVDGSTLTSGFWEVGQPGYHRLENCALSQPEWHDYPCTSFFKSICEKKIF
ncbi:C-type lectin domain family 10 member A-like isoform X2 [Triplophysa dalaica]|uniref:C-type lectin domain family 10 member A-like isoform X2 n=1 Tax=Triplophysa dalaica TaxID=1582913 RepID=UPI0024DF5E42|nr:C-type lectin domain family 10 member A-like isoform X2 [Triplophysa dalaica]